MSSVPPRARFVVTTDVVLDGPVDEDERVASVPQRFTTKGMYLADLMSRVEPAERERVFAGLAKPPRGGVYQPFLPYPFFDAILWLHAVAKQEYPEAPLLEAMRLLGRDTVRVFLQSQAGRVVKELMSGPLGSLLRMPDMWKITDPECKVTAEAIEPCAVRYEIEGFPAWIDCGVIGTLEQVVLHYGVEPTIEVDLRGPMLATLVVRWSERR